MNHPLPFASMKSFARVLSLILLGALPAFAAERVPWTSSHLVGSPTPPPPYTIEAAFPNLKFNNLVEMTAAPGSDRLFVMEQKGKVYSFPNRPDVANPDLFVDLSDVKDYNESYSMVFHPGYATNHYVYLTYVLKGGNPEGSRVSRFTVTDNPPRIDRASEKIMITWLSGGHNGGSLQFGPDGCLYISTGDGEVPSPPDPRNTGQDISDLLSSILRIDVDHEEDGRAYRVPPDNPFVKTPNARPEVWAYGLRNPWKMSFDRTTGALWVGDVGWELWEMVYRIQRGGNYGWSAMEAYAPVKPNGKHGPSPILPPIAAHTHVEARSITGGYVYRGSRLPQLAGTYLYGDWVTGKIWGLPATATQKTTPREIANTPLAIICFAEDNAHELYVVGYSGTIHRFIPNPAQKSHGPFPTKLSQTGLFASVKDQQPAPGVIPYGIQTEPWMDHATAERFVGLPGMSKLEDQARDDRMQGKVKGNWAFPTNAVLAKTISIETERGNPKSSRRLETQVLHFDGVAWNAYDYLWNDAQTDAELAGPGGTDRTITIKDPSAPGGQHQQKWHFASRTECLLCHMPWSGYILGFHSWELEGAKAASGDASSQLDALKRLNLFVKAPKPANPPNSDTLDQRARNYLQVNCAHCHQFGGGGGATFDVRRELSRDDLKLIDVKPTQGDFGFNDPRVVAPGDPYHSILMYRMSKTGSGRMPHFASSEVDAAGMQLMREWITSLKPDATREPEAALQSLKSGPASGRDQSSGGIDALLGSMHGSLALALEVNRPGSSLPAAVREAAIEHANASPQPAVRDLFEHFLPDNRRVPRLGAGFKPDAVLSLKGNAARGEKIFSADNGAGCANCHKAKGQGKDFGPDLSLIAKKYPRAALLEQIMEPSKVIEPQYASYLIECNDGQTYSGVIARQSPTEIVLRDPTGKDTAIPTATIKLQQKSTLSAMPEGLLQNLTAQEAADLLAWLQTMK